MGPLFGKVPEPEQLKRRQPRPTPWCVPLILHAGRNSFFSCVSHRSDLLWLSCQGRDGRVDRRGSRTPHALRNSRRNLRKDDFVLGLLKLSLNTSGVMFSCACSLRSTQCAALIALAAAAGIMRIETAHPEAPEAPRNSEGVSATEVVVSAESARYYHASAENQAPWLRLIELTTDVANEAVAEVTWVTAPSIRSSGRFTSADDVVTLSPRQHSYPFAVGPPDRGSTWIRRVADTRVSGDSAARRTFFSRVAAVWLVGFSAPLLRHENRVPFLAREFFEPSSAPRGEPEDFTRFAFLSCRPAFAAAAPRT